MVGDEVGVLPEAEALHRPYGIYSGEHARRTEGMHAPRQKGGSQPGARKISRLGVQLNSTSERCDIVAADDTHYGALV